jgi:hypothetical protein
MIRCSPFGPGIDEAIPLSPWWRSKVWFQVSYPHVRITLQTGFNEAISNEFSWGITAL